MSNAMTTSNYISYRASNTSDARNNSNGRTLCKSSTSMATLKPQVIKAKSK